MASAAAFAVATQAGGSDMGYLATSTHAAVIANPQTYIPTLYSNVRSIFLNDLPAGMQGMPEALNKLAFATILAFDLKPYGTSGALTLADCLNSPVLDCDNYAALAIEISKILNGQSFNPAMVGWNGGAVGNHAQILMTYSGTHLMCDPTVGFLAKDMTLDGLCRGYPPMAGRYKSFFNFNSNRTNVAPLSNAVVNAVVGGTYMASSLLYWFPTLDHYRATPGSAAWATPQSWNIP